MSLSSSGLSMKVPGESNRQISNDDEQISLDLYAHDASSHLEYNSIFPETLSDEQKEAGRWRWLSCRGGLRNPRDQRNFLFYSIYSLMMLALLVAIILPSVSNQLSFGIEFGLALSFALH